MRQEPQRLDRRRAAAPGAYSIEGEVVDFLLAIEEQVLLARKVVEHRHATHVGGMGDLVDRDVVEALVEYQSRRGVGDCPPCCQSLACPSVHHWNDRLNPAFYTRYTNGLHIDWIVGDGRGTNGRSVNY